MDGVGSLMCCFWPPGSTERSTERWLLRLAIPGWRPHEAPTLQLPYTPPFFPAFSCQMCCQPS